MTVASSLARHSKSQYKNLVDSSVGGVGQAVDQVARHLRRLDVQTAQGDNYAPIVGCPRLRCAMCADSG